MCRTENGNKSLLSSMMKDKKGLDYLIKLIFLICTSNLCNNYFHGKRANCATRKVLHKKEGLIIWWNLCRDVSLDLVKDLTNVKRAPRCDPLHKKGLMKWDLDILFNIQYHWEFIISFQLPYKYKALSCRQPLAWHIYQFLEVFGFDFKNASSLFIYLLLAVRLAGS